MEPTPSALSPVDLASQFATCQKCIRSNASTEEERTQAWQAMHRLLEQSFSLKSVDDLRKLIVAQVRPSRGMADPVLREIGCTRLLADIPPSIIRLLAEHLGHGGELRPSPELKESLKLIWRLACLANTFRRDGMKQMQIEMGGAHGRPQLLRQLEGIDEAVSNELEVHGIFTAWELHHWKLTELSDKTGLPLEKLQPLSGLLRAIDLTFVK